MLSWESTAAGVRVTTAQGVGILLGGDALDARTQGPRHLARQRHLEPAGAVLGRQGGIGRDIGRVRAEAFQPHLSVDPESPRDGADADAVFGHVTPLQ